jgi:hypothetical protein
VHIDLIDGMGMQVLLLSCKSTLVLYYLFDASCMMGIAVPENYTIYGI